MKKIIEVDNLTIKAKKDRKTIIENLSFELFEGEVVLLKGRNGSGKSTIIKALVQEEKNKYLTSGNITYNQNLNITNLIKDKELYRYRTEIVYVPQTDDYSGHYNLTVKDVVSDSINSFAGEKVSLSEIESILLKFDFESGESVGERFNMKSDPSKLSGGQQRILTFLANVIARPGAYLYIIDEPLNNLDYKNIPNVVALIKEMHYKNPKSAFIIVTHNENFDFISRTIEI